MTAAPVTIVVVVALLMSACEKPRTQSDFNGDGVDDLAVGAPDEAVGDVEAAGAVNVIYGAVDRRVRPGPRLRADNNQIWHQERTGVASVAEADDQFGASIAVGDFDSDGKDDLAIGIPGENDGSGAVQILYGSPAGLTSSRSRLWTQATTGHGASEPGDRFGDALASGDFNGDGRADLAIGAPGENEGAGAVNILYGGPQGLTATASQIWTENSEGISGEATPRARFGAALAAGDFGISRDEDLAIGAPGKRVDGQDSAGSVHVLYGARTGLSATNSQEWTQDSPGVVGEPEFEDGFGGVLAAGNFGRGRTADLAIGMPGEDSGGFITQVSNAGGVNVLYGSNAGLTGEASQFWSLDSDDIETPSQEDGFLGAALAAADFGLSSEDDLAIGIPGTDFGEEGSAGMVLVLYGTLEGLSSKGHQVWVQGLEALSGQPEFADAFGRSLAAANFGGSIHADLAVGVPGDAVGGSKIGTFSSAKTAGTVHVIYGTPGGLTATGDQIWSQDSDGISGMAEEFDRFGQSLHQSY